MSKKRKKNLIFAIVFFILIAITFTADIKYNKTLIIKKFYLFQIMNC